MLTFILFTAVIAALFAHQWMKRAKLPPGPMPLPLIGNLHQLAWRMMKTGGIVETFKLFKKEYGSVFTVWLGPMPTVHLAEIGIAQEAMVKQGSHFVNRWIPELMDVGRDGYGIIATNGALWQEQRRFALHTLRNFGLGRNVMEERIMAEVNMRFNDLEAAISNGDNLINPYDFFDLMVGSIINRMLFSVRFDETNQKEFFALKHSIDYMVENVSVLDLYMKKWWMEMPIIGSRYRKLTNPVFGLKGFLIKQVRDRIVDIESGKHIIDAEPSDYVDAFLMKMRDEENVKDTSFSEQSLVVNLMDLWIAGQETTTTTLLWAMVLFINNPEEMAKVRDEITRVTGNTRTLSLQDKSETPYLNATITEIQRHASILNVNLWRQNPEDSVIGGFRVAKGTPITAQLSVIMSDEKTFEDEHKFLPSRFLSGDRLDQHVIPFGIGKRACLGESLARAELYLIIGNLLQRFDLLPDGKLPDTTALTKHGLLRRPRRFMMRINPIKH